MGNVKRVGRENFQTRIRFVNGLTVYYSQKDSIYVTDGKMTIVIERWFDGLNTYRERWKPMTDVLFRNKSLATIYDCWRVAERYNVCRHMGRRFPEVKAGTIIVKEKEDK